MMPVPRNMGLNGDFSLLIAVALLLLIVKGTSGLPFAEVELYEGNPCTTENGTIGECKKLPECPPRVEEVRSGRRTTSGRCSFQNFVEIVCCPLSVLDKIGVRPADAACHEYENEVTPNSDNAARNSREGDLVFHILGGTRAAAGEFPYMAALGYENTDGEVEDSIVYECGGTLISSRFVLTAAHCVSNINGKFPVRVRVGSEDLKSPTSNAQEIAVARSIPHPKYKRSVNYNDIALLRLSRAARMSNSVKPICLQTRSLNKSDMNAKGTSFLAIGFGATSFEVGSSDNLMKTANLSLVPTNVCSRSYEGFAKLPSGLDEHMICALDSNTTRGSDACQGDSGGPLLMISDKVHSIIGVTSFGQSCGGPVPAVYTSVYSYLDWIESHVWPEPSDQNVKA